MLEIRRYFARFAILSVLLLVPFLRLLLREEYGLWYPEVLAAVVLLLAIAAGIASIARNRWVYHATVIATAVLLSTNALQTNFLPATRFRWLIAAVVLGMAAGLLALRRHFYSVVLLFVLGGFAVDVGKAVFRHVDVEPARAVSADQKRHHVVHLVLDEMMGLAGLPPECSECTHARSVLEDVLGRGNFRTYPYAFSNYRMTRNSVPSILHGALVSWQDQYFPPYQRRRLVRENRYFARYRAKNYRIRTYQSTFMLYDAPEFDRLAAQTYEHDALKALHILPLSWRGRLYQTFAVYLQADAFWWGIWTRALPARLDPKRLPMYPLAVRDVWPQDVLRDMKAARQDTLFFVHLLLPHFPYLYRPDGTIRPLSEWEDDGDAVHHDRGSYWRMYGRYGEQVEFVARQLDAFFSSLRSTGQYDSTTIIIHGDHGPRFLFMKERDERKIAFFHERSNVCPALPLYQEGDRAAQREFQGAVADTFSALLAIKLPGVASPETVPDPGSVLYFLRQTFGPSVSPAERADLNAMYLFDRGDRPCRIPATELWPGAKQDRVKDYGW